MGELSCTIPFFIYPSLFLILFFSFINHHFHFFAPPLLSLSNHTTQGSRDFYNGRSRNTTTLHAILSRSERIEKELGRARSAIRQAARSRTYGSYTKEDVEDFFPTGSLYINPYAFYQSHKEMLKGFRVWSYKEGEVPLFHYGPMSSIYSIEGHFIEELESGTSSFAASNPDEATAFFLPVSVVNIIQFVYRPYITYSRLRLQNIVKDYISSISNKYPYWNRSSGADHFLVSCHDWAPYVSESNPKLYKHFIRVLCNANSSEGFRPVRDVSLPEVQVHSQVLHPPSLGQPPKNRSVFAFFAGHEHGYVRKMLFRHWKDKDTDIQVHDYLPKTSNYSELMGQSRFCLCPSGYEVASPRVVDAIHAGCVPVIISDNYVLPFSDALNWSRFSVHIPVAKIPKIKKILQGIADDEYLAKQKRVIQVQKHFVLNRPAKPYDLIHMIMHSVWLRRLNMRYPQ